MNKMADLQKFERKLLRISERYTSLAKNDRHQAEVGMSQAKGDYPKRTDKTAAEVGMSQAKGDYPKRTNKTAAEVGMSQAKGDYPKRAAERDLIAAKTKRIAALLQKHGAGDVPNNIKPGMTAQPFQQIVDKHLKARRDYVPAVPLKKRQSSTNRSRTMQYHVAPPKFMETVRTKTIASCYRNGPTAAANGKKNQPCVPPPLPPRGKKPVSVQKQPTTVNKSQPPKATQNHAWHGGLRKNHDRGEPIKPFYSTKVVYFNRKFVPSPSLLEVVKSEKAAVQENSSYMCSVAKKCKRGKKEIPAQSEGLIRYLQGKIGTLENDHKRLCQEVALQKRAFQKAVEAQKKAVEERDKALANQHQIKVKFARHEVLLQEANRRLREQSKLPISNSKELIVAKRDMKMLSHTNAKLERRLAQVNEELSHARISLDLLKNNDFHIRELCRMQTERKDKEIKVLKKQRADLLSAQKNQLLLIENLKRQNVCLESSKLNGIGEREFVKVLEWTTTVD